MGDRSPRPGSQGRRDDLVASLVADLRPIPLWQRPPGIALLWLGLSVLSVLLMSRAYGPWRPDSLTQLTSVPRFALEIGVAVLGFWALAWAAIQTAIPAALGGGRAVGWLVLAWAPWLALLGVGLFDPALTPGMVGKREDCYLEVMVESLPPLILGLWLLKRLYPLQGRRSGVFLGLAAGMLPALLMQLSCMYEPGHAWSHHVAPVLVPATLGALAGGWLLRPKSVSPTPS